MVESKILWAAWIELVTMIIWEMSGNWVAWLILHLIANNSTSVMIILIAWWSVFLIGLEQEWTWAMEVVTLFLILVSEAIITELAFDEAL